MGVWIGTGALLLMTMGNSTFGRQVDLPHADVVDGVRVNYKPYEDTWTAFKKTFERRYVTDVEDKSRFVLLAENLKMMEQHNRKYVAGKESYFVDINDFTDRTDAEIRSMYYGHLNVVHQEDHHTRSITGCTSYVPSTVENLPTHVDWREKDCVTPVKNQGLCGSCYAFGSIASLETQMCKETGNLTELSEQQVVDCCGQGCDGGDGVTVFKCLRKLGGVMSAADYPYVAKQENCSFIKDKSKVMVAGCKSVDGESAKKFAVALVGPLYSAIIADGPLLRYYKGGIFNDTTCSGDVNHAITIVGYGTEGNTPIWIVKNSWGVDTGVQGYLKIKRGDNICNIESSTSYFPVAHKVVTPVPVIGLITSQPSNAEKEGLRTWLLLPAIALLVLCCWYNRRFLIIVLKRVIRCYHFV